MRSTDDELWVLTITAAAAHPPALASPDQPDGLGDEGRSAKLYAAVGRALLHCPGLLAPGTPVRCLLEGGRPDPQWRSSLPVVERSLWAELQLLRTLATDATTGSAFDELLALRLAVSGRLDTVV